MIHLLAVPQSRLEWGCQTAAALSAFSCMGPLLCCLDA